MAKITTGPIVGEARGKAGDIVFNRNRGGNYARALKVTAAGAGAGDGCALYNSELITIPTDETLVLSLDSEHYDVGNIHSPTVQPTRITIAKAGVYLLIANLDVVVAAAAEGYGNILLNGAIALSIAMSIRANAGDLFLSFSTLANLNIADYVEATIVQTSGQNAQLITTEEYPPVLAAQQLTST